jgi:demethylmenaquinone methyltransferase / 2-methoxy-6-polyprenyl-1,4-benzoquinol methylase
LAAVARFHVHRMVPWLGGLLSGAQAYAYLRDSVAAFPPATEFATSMEASGLTNVRASRLGFGAAHLYTGVSR